MHTPGGSPWPQLVPSFEPKMHIPGGTAQTGGDGEQWRTLYFSDCIPWADMM